MNRLEFNEIMKATDLYNPVATTGGRYDTEEDVHCWNNLGIWFGGSYYTVVHGKIPIEVADRIYKKYPGNPYEIRVEGGSSDNIPSEWARGSKTNEADERYIGCYHIDTKEGLIIFLTEMKDYYLRKNNLPETEVKRYDEILEAVTSGILKEVNPTISAYEWMQSDKKNKAIYNATIGKEKRNAFKQVFRKIISDFDKAVNPFLDSSIELDDIGNYLDKVRIDGFTYNRENGVYRKGCCSLEITSLDNKGSVSYKRCAEGFSFQLVYKLGEDNFLQVIHYYSADRSKEYDNGEFIAIDSLGKNAKKENDLRYNVSKGLAGSTYGEKTPVTTEQLYMVLDCLLKATEFAKEITVKNMEKDNSIKLTK